MTDIKMTPGFIDDAIALTKIARELSSLMEEKSDHSWKLQAAEAAVAHAQQNLLDAQNEMAVIEEKIANVIQTFQLQSWSVSRRLPKEETKTE